MTAKLLSRKSRSPADTRALARTLAAHLVPGDVVALTGELGSGKTEFVRGLAQGLGVPAGEAVASPSFILAHVYNGRLPLVHLDLYRLDELPLELLPDLEDYLFGPHVAVVEWAERAVAILPENYVEILMTISGENDRDLAFVPHGARGEELLEKAFPETV